MDYKVSMQGYSWKTGPAAQTDTAETKAEAKAEEAALEEERQQAIKAKEDEVLLNALERFKEDSGTYSASTSSATFKISTSKPSDDTMKLTQRLVAAVMQSEVQSVISSAYSSISSLRIIAALSKGQDAAKASAIIGRLQKLIARADRKITDLNNEDGLRSRKTKAEQTNQIKRAQEIKEELRKRILERRRRENGYLRETRRDKFYFSYDEKQPLDPATEAALEAEAVAMAAAEVAAGGGVDAGGDVGGGTEGGGEAAAGGESAGTAAEGGGGEAAAPVAE